MQRKTEVKNAWTLDLGSWPVVLPLQKFMKLSHLFAKIHSLNKCLLNTSCMSGPLFVEQKTEYSGRERRARKIRKINKLYIIW